MLYLSFAYKKIADPVLDLSFSYKELVNLNLGLSFSYSEILNTSIDLSFSFQPKPKKFYFDGDHAVGISDFDIQALIDGKEEFICEWAEELNISHGENESYVARFVVLPKKERGNPRPIDPYKWYSKPIEINAVHEFGIVRLFTGIVDKMGMNVLKGRFEIECSDRRERQINALPASMIKSIGYTSESAHGIEFDNLSDELAQRLNTIPASFEFDATGTPYLTPWREKEVADFVLNPCFIYQEEPIINLVGAGDVLNSVTARVRLSYSRLRQRQVRFGYDSEQNVCTYALYGRLADADEIATAVRATGWNLWGFDFQMLEPSGWYNCNGNQTGWIRDSIEEQGNRRYRRTFLTVKSGVFEGVKRWRQSVGQEYVLKLTNQGSISRYEFNSVENISLSVSSNSKDEEDWGNDYAPHQNGIEYEKTTNNHIAYPFSREPKFKKMDFKKVSNGDWVADLVGENDLEATLKVAYYTAYTALLASHRQNTVELSAKFLAQIDLRHTHEIQHSHFTGKCKVQHFEHIISFKLKKAKTRVRYAFFQNSVDGELTPYTPANKPKPSYPNYENYFILRKKEISENADASNYFGMVYRYKLGKNGRKLYTAEHFAVRTPDIEKEATDSVNETATTDYEVGIFNTEFKVMI